MGPTRTLGVLLAAGDGGQQLRGGVHGEARQVGDSAQRREMRVLPPVSWLHVRKSEFEDVLYVVYESPSTKYPPLCGYPPPSRRDSTISRVDGDKGAAGAWRTV